MADLTAANIEVLRLLNRYRFLTNPQLLRLGLVHDNTSIYRILSRFGDGNRPYIGKKDFGFIAGVGRLHRIYYLQKRGAQFDTLRLRLIKVAARIVEMKTRIKIHLPSSAPDQAVWHLVLARLPRLIR